MTGFLAMTVIMLCLVLAANLFADAVRDAFDPRIRNLAVRHHPANLTAARKVSQA